MPWRATFALSLHQCRIYTVSKTKAPIHRQRIVKFPPAWSVMPRMLVSNVMAKLSNNWLPSTSIFIISSFSSSNEENSKTLAPKPDFAYWSIWGLEWGELGKIASNCTVGMFGDEICPSFLYNLVMAKREGMIAAPKQSYSATRSNNDPV